MAINMPRRGLAGRTGAWSASARRVLEERYLWRDDTGELIEDPDGMCWRVAMAVAAGEVKWGHDPEAVAEQFAEIMIDRKFMPNSPTLMNAGKDNGLQLSACFVLPVEDSMEGIFESVKHAAIIHKSGGGCIAGDSRVWTTFCGIEPISVLVNRAIADGRPGVPQGAGVAYDVRDLGIQTASMHPTTGETGLRPVSHVWRFDVPAENQVCVTTREGTVIQTSDWHPFMVMRDTSLIEVAAADVKPGDVLLGPERPDGYWPWTETRTVGSLNVDADLGWLIGFTLGDGSFGYVPALRQYRVRWFSGSADVLDRVRDVLAGQGIQVSIQRDARGLLSVTTLSQRFVHDLLEACGLEKIGPRDARIRVPEVIAKSPLTVVRAFLAGLLDSDGYVDHDGSPSYTSVSGEMAEDLAALLGLLGYQPTVSAKAAPGKGRRTTHTVQLCPLPQVDDLAGDLAPYLAHGERRARLHSDSRRQTGLRLAFGAWRDRLAELGLVKARGDKAGGPGPCAEELNRWSCNPEGRVRRDDLRAIATRTEPYDASLASLLHRLAASGQEVARVERAAVAKPYFDLTVEGWNTYAAGRSGLAMVHNTGFAFSRLRPEGATVSSTHGAASGPVSFMRVFNEATEAVKQGGTRRGANMGILRIDHPDVLKFIDCKRTGGITNFNISLAVTQKFVDALRADTDYELVDPHDGRVTGTLRAKVVFDKIAEAAWASGDPGLVFIDRINSSPANPTPEVGLIEATNPCVTGETLVYTAQGLRRAADLAGSGRPVRVTVDGDTGFADASPVFRTGRKPVFRLTTVEGYEVRLTADHRVMTKRGWVPAGELVPGDRLKLLSHPGGFGQGGTLALGRLLGWLIGDGTMTSDRAVLSFFGSEKQELAPAFAAMMHEVVPAGAGKRREYPISVEDLPQRDEARVRSARFWRIAAEHGLRPGDKHRVPETVLAGSDVMQRGFLQALFTADGHVSGHQENGISVRLTSVDRGLLLDVQRLLLNFGIASRLFSNRRDGGLRTLPDGRGGHAEYETRAYHDLVIAKDNLHRFAATIGFLSEGKQATLVSRLGDYRRGPYQERFTARFEALVADGEEEVYDLTEPLTHSFVANGLVVHNCGEQPLLGYEACNLGSVNLAQLVVERNGRRDVDWEELDRVCRVSIRFLDDVIEVNPYPLPQIHEMVKANRRVGLGVMGWADLLFRLGIPYDSEEALQLADRVMSRINRAAHEATEELAVERGPFPNWSRSIYRDGKPMRNSTVTTIAPTGTISIISDCSSGVEPIFALAFVHKSGDRLLRFVNPIFEQSAKAQGFYSDQVMQDVLFHGSAHGVAGVPNEAQRVFVTAHEIAPDWHVRMQAAFQRHTDNAVSKTINLPNSATVEDVRHSYLLAYELGCLGITVFRDGSKGEQVLNAGVGGGEKKAEAEAKPAEPVLEARVKERPAVVFGYTTQIVAPEGKVNVTLNSDETGLLEVFINIGKAGSDLAALAEAMGRLISLNLRLPSPMTQEDRVREIIDQLQGIGGSRTIGFGQAQLRSLPDALAKVLERHITEHPSPLKLKAAEEQPPLPGLLHTGNLCPKCGCSTLVFEEGCKKCYACGHSEC